MNNDSKNVIKNNTNGTDELIKKSYMLIEKVFNEYKGKEYLANIIINCEKDNIKNINFKPCKVIIGSLNDNEKNKKVELTLKIPYEILTKKGENITGFLPDINRHILLDEAENYESILKFIVKTYTKVMFYQDLFNNTTKFTFIVKFMIRSIGQVRLLLPDTNSITSHNDINNISNDIIKKVGSKSKIKSEELNSTQRIIYGRIIDTNTLEGVDGAVVGLFHGKKTTNLQMLCHTYSDHNGYYILNIPVEFNQSIVTIMASKTIC